MPEGILVGWELILPDGQKRLVTQDAVELGPEASALLDDWLDWPDVALLHGAVQEAVDLVCPSGAQEPPVLFRQALSLKAPAPSAKGLFFDCWKNCGHVYTDIHPI